METTVGAKKSHVSQGRRRGNVSLAKCSLAPIFRHALYVYNGACNENDIILTTSHLFHREPNEATRHPHIQQWHSFIPLPMQTSRVTVEAGWLQRSISAWHERFSVGVWRTGTHITALWARQPLSNYREPGQALLRHALNFAQDRWGPAEYAAESSVPTANRCRLRG